MSSVSEIKLYDIKIEESKETDSISLYLPDALWIHIITFIGNSDTLHRLKCVNKMARDAITVHPTLSPYPNKCFGCGRNSFTYMVPHMREGKMVNKCTTDGCMATDGHHSVRKYAEYCALGCAMINHKT
jgi:hypothetical protein